MVTKLSEPEYKIFKYEMNNEDFTKIGFFEENDLIISITACLIVNEFVFLTDEVHKNIKKINLKTGEMINSGRLTKATHFKQLNDLGIIENNLFIPSTGKTVFVSDIYFSKTDSFCLPTKGIDPVFVKSSSDSTIEFLVEFADSIFVINKNYEVKDSYRLLNEEKRNWESKFDFGLGKLKDKNFEFRKTNNADFVKINGKEIKLIKKFEYCSDIINFDFNDKYMIIYEFYNTEFILYVYNLNSI